MATARNRRLELLKQGATLNGIDFVEVRELEPTRLYVHFLNGIDVATAQVKLTISGGDVTPTVAVLSFTWSSGPEGQRLLTVNVSGRGDHSFYTLRVENAVALDPYFSAVQFSFFSFCPSPLDCRPAQEVCPQPNDPLPVIDYLAKDYESFRRALSDFSTQRYPEWQERAEADVGMVMLDLLSAVGDELSYIQDQGHLQARIDTATRRDAVVRLARMVDYEPAPVVSAHTDLQCDVDTNTSSLPAGIAVSALAPDGSTIPFETGAGIRDKSSYPVSAKWNAKPGIAPYWWDDNDRCLAPGTTSMLVGGNGFGFYEGQALLIDTAGLTGADPHIRQVVRLTTVEELTDPLFNLPLTRLTWRPEDALTEYRDLERTKLAGNLVPATQGRRRVENFVIRTAPAVSPRMARAIARLGPNSTADAPSWVYRYTLGASPLGYLPTSDGRLRPEVVVSRASAPAGEWKWVSSLLEAGEFDESFTIDPGAWRPVANLNEGVCYDYDGSDGATIRFGDGQFGARPADADIFEVQYRESRGAIGRVPADAISVVDPAWSKILTAVTNPFSAKGGEDAEIDEQVRQRAPAAFRTRAYRAVRPEDYNEAASRLSWVQRGGTVFRWTGSWNSIFVTADPRNAGEISRDQHIELSSLLNRVRLAGYEVFAPTPVYVSFDLKISVCAKASAFQADVLAGIDRALRPVRDPNGRTGYFHVDNFTLGTPFERSRLEAEIQSVAGVAGILSIQYRQRGQSAGDSELPGVLSFGPGAIFRMDNDSNHPERGFYSIDVKGGK